MAVLLGAVKKEPKANAVIFDGKTFYGYEPYFEKQVEIARIYGDGIRPMHGYFYPHPLGKRVKAMAKKLGVKFINK